MKNKPILAILSTLLLTSCGNITPDSSSSTLSSSSSSEVISSITASSSSSSSSEIISSSEAPKSEFAIANGGYRKDNDNLITTQDSTLVIKNDSTFEQGTISCDINLNGNSGDNGIVFGLINDNELDRFWENQGIYYYFFFISVNGTAYLGKVNNQTWINCSETIIPNLNRSKTYNLKVSREIHDDYASINCYIDNQLFASYLDYDHYNGKGYGIRSAKSNVQYSNLSLSDEIFDSTVKINGFTVANGAFENKDDSIVSSVGNSIAEKENGTFVYGTFEATINTNGQRGDNGIIFSITPNDTHTYWESNASYYFFFININGYAHLGRVEFGSWVDCDIQYIPGYNANNSYKLKVEKTDSSINCFVNDSQYITYTDSFPLEGTGYGLRSALSNVSYSDISCSSTGTIEETYPNDIEVVNGKFTGKDGAIKSKLGGSIGLIKGKTLKEGTFATQIKAISTKRSGLIFNYTKNGSNESYYRFVTKKENQAIEIDKVVNGQVTNLYSNYLSAGYSSGTTYSFKVVISGNEAYCYFSNILYYVASIESIDGRIGFYSEGASTCFSNYTTTGTKDITKVNTLLFGHSYFELWKNYQQDLSNTLTTYNLGTCTNIGIGGSIASQWDHFKESLVKYEANTVIYMIGINDLSGRISPTSIMTSVQNTLSFMKDKNPDLNVVLLSVNHCPARSNIRSEISNTNQLMKSYCQTNEWIKYAELEYAFCNNGSTPDSYWFTDGLHPTEAGYREKIVPAINNALAGNNQ